jgi:hypothetical protein
MSRSFWIGFVIIFSCYSIYELTIVETDIAILLGRKGRHLLKFIIIGANFFLGYLFLKPKWINDIWKYSFIIIFTFLIIFGLIDWFIYKIPMNLRSLLYDLSYLFIQPSFYMILGLLDFVYKSENTASKIN